MQTIEIIDPKYEGMETQKRSVAVVVFYDSKGRVLLQDRKSISKAGEDWGLFGGGIEKGEDPESALKRELREEIANLPQNLLFEYVCIQHVIYYNPKKKNFRELFKDVFRCKLSNNFKAEVLEGDGAAWFDQKELSNMKVSFGDFELIQWLASS